MKVVCISAANTKLMGKNSTSIKVCELIKDIIKKDHRDDAVVDTIALVDYELKPCVLCGNCVHTRACIYDEYFNNVLEQLSKADAVFFVVPHYSPIPSKMVILFEKLNEIAYGSWLNNTGYVLPFGGKPVGIIGHGGMAEKDEVLKYYHDSLITPVANTLKSLSFNVVGLDEVYTNGAPFGLKDENCLKKVDGSIFPEIIQDYDLIKDRIQPMIENVTKKVFA
jgi:multimeric flavodoxin WrbA